MPTFSKFVYTFYALIAATGLLVANADAATRSAINAAKAILEETYAADEPGAAIIVMEKGEIILQQGYGSANLEWQLPISSDTVFRIGSITKQFTAAGIILLNERGELSISDSISEYLPDYPTHGHNITIEHLLTHTSGIMSYTNIAGYMEGGDIRHDLSTEELVDVFEDLPMEFAPGTSWNYNNSGYVLLGAIIEKVSGESYAEFIANNITGPLGLANTHYEDSSIVPNRAAGYFAVGQGEYVNAAHLSMTQPHAAGSLISTVGDLATWNNALVNGELISQQSYEQMTAGFRLADGELYPYGFGLGLGKLREEPIIAHSGGIHGFSAYGLWHPEKQIYVAVLTNVNGYPQSPTTTGKKVAAAIIGDPYPERKAITLNESQMSKYTGSYSGEEAPPIKVSVVEGALQMEFAGAATYDLHAEDTDTLFISNSLWYIDVRWTNGVVVEMALHMSEGEPPLMVTPVGN
jgi:D-alanyl-D-alanine carboxypeptidase